MALLPFFWARPGPLVHFLGPARPVVIKLFLGPFGPVSINYSKTIAFKIFLVKTHSSSQKRRQDFGSGGGEHSTKNYSKSFKKVLKILY
jgi:hypothetical protein